MDIKVIHDNLQSILLKTVNTGTVTYLRKFTKFDTTKSDANMRRLIDTISKDGDTDLHDYVCETLMSITDLVISDYEGKFSIESNIGRIRTIHDLINKYRESNSGGINLTNMIVRVPQADLDSIEFDNLEPLEYSELVHRFGLGFTGLTKNGDFVRVV